ncbi:hypothetical protein ACQEV4_09795 [Streptomyces shenzhenensis]|uniref:hypothetical protein n=1 Tax=Streptomyces shenzhenensis TaxID=943815 RepID=UPI003D92D76B
MPSPLPDKPCILAPDHALGGAVERRTRLFYRHRTTPGAARTFVAEALTQWGRTERLDSARLCVSELARSTTPAEIDSCLDGGTLRQRLLFGRTRAE